jgi:type I restriction enzyme, S subunit
MKLLEHFKELSLHPKNAEELKGLILQLAVQGKLTANWREKNPNVESASILFNKIQEEKAELIKQKKIRNERVKKRFAKSTAQFNVPNTWESCNLTEVYYTIGGKENQIKTNEYLDKGYYPVVSQGKKLIEGYSNNESKVLKVLKPVVVFGDHTRVVKLIDFDFIIGADGVKILSPCSHILSEYFFFYLSSIDLSSRGYARHYSHLKNEPFSLPPLEEQKAIVAVVNTLFKEVEQLESLTKERIQLKESFVVSAFNRLTESENTQQEWNFLQQHFSSFFTEKKNIKSLRETILQLAVQGKLTKFWRANNPNTEPASELLKRIEAEKQQLIAEKKIKKEKPLPPIEEGEIPYEFPEGWVWCRLTELVNVGTGSTPAKSNVSYYQGGTIPWYTSSATNDNYAKVQDVLITQKALDETNCKVFPSGSLIIALYGQGKTRGQISEVITPGATNQAIAAMVFFENSKGVKEYLKHFFKKIYHEIRQLAEGGAQPNLNVGKVKNTRVPLPPLEEIIEIVEKVNSLMALCDQLEQQIDNSQTQIEQLMQSCLKEVFEHESN